MIRRTRGHRVLISRIRSCLLCAVSNGLHTIAWIVRDNTGATHGIGGRFFTVANSLAHGVRGS
jgi:hypothetical protein